MTINTTTRTRIFRKSMPRSLLLRERLEEPDPAIFRNPSRMELIDPERRAWLWRWREAFLRRRFLLV
jgi:hypothetical protein